MAAEKLTLNINPLADVLPGASSNYHQEGANAWDFGSAAGSRSVGSSNHGQWGRFVANEGTPDLCRYEIRKNEIYFTLNTFEGQMKSHIRHYGRNEDSVYPTKRGVCMDLDVVKKFEICIDRIDEQIHRVKTGQVVDWKSHIGDMIFVGVSSTYKRVDIRKFYIRQGECLKRAGRGVSLTFDEYERKLKCCFELMPDLISGWSDREPCFHGNQMAELQCTICTEVGEMVFDD
jgi:hypothetical protein